MFDELEKYKDWNHFFYKLNDNLKEVCNAPTNKSGVYIVYSLKNGRVDLIYIGRSGKLDKTGTMTVRKAGLGGIKDRLMNGHQFGKVPRKISWTKQMKAENIEALDIYWYSTHDQTCLDCPRIVEKQLLSKYFDLYGHMPKWNNEI